MLDATDKAIINGLQGGFPIAERPYAAAAEQFGLGEQELMDRLARLKEQEVISRFGPMYNADRMGGAFCLCAMAVPEEHFEEVVDKINAHREVAHNYARTHTLNVWFVLASDRPGQIDEIVNEIEEETGLRVHAFPKLEEFFIGLKVDVK